MSGRSRPQPDLHRRLQGVVLLAATAACVAAILFLVAAMLAQRQNAADRTILATDHWMLLAAIGCVALMLGSLVRVVQMASHLAAPRPHGEHLSVTDHSERALRRAELLVEAADRRRKLTERVLSVGRATLGVLDLDVLVRGAVEAISRDFEPACVGVFLLDDEPGLISLRAGLCESGEAPAPHSQGLAESQGRLGWCIANAQPRVWSEDAADLLLRRDVGPTQEGVTEVVLPLRNHERAFGALVLQDQYSGAFDAATVSALQEIADQLGGAIGIVRAFEEAERALGLAREALGQHSRDSFLQLLPDKGLGLRRLPDGTVEQTRDEWEDDVVKAVAGNSTVRQDRALVIPIRIWDMAVGAVRLQKPAEAPGWTDREIALADAVVGQVGYALESARLRTELRSVTGEAQPPRGETGRSGAAQDWDGMVQTAVDEIGRALHATRVYVEWMPTETGGSGRDSEATGSQDGVQDR